MVTSGEVLKTSELTPYRDPAYIDQILRFFRDNSQGVTLTPETECELVEVSIHVDTTQRGRVGSAYKNATSEVELNPLRDEFVQLLSSAQQSTGRTLRAGYHCALTGRWTQSGAHDCQ